MKLQLLVGEDDNANVVKSLAAYISYLRAKVRIARMRVAIAKAT